MQAYLVGERVGAGLVKRQILHLETYASLDCISRVAHDQVCARLSSPLLWQLFTLLVLYDGNSILSSCYATAGKKIKDPRSAEELTCKGLTEANTVFAKLLSPFKMPCTCRVRLKSGSLTESDSSAPKQGCGSVALTEEMNLLLIRGEFGDAAAHSCR